MQYDIWDFQLFLFSWSFQPMGQQKYAHAFETWKLVINWQDNFMADITLLKILKLQELFYI